MARLLQEGIIAAAGSGSGGGNGGGTAAPADTTLGTRKNALLTKAASYSTAGTVNYTYAAWALAKYAVGNQAGGDISVDQIIAGKQPLQNRIHSFEPYWWPLIKMYGTPNTTRSNQLRDLTASYNTMQNINTSDPTQSFNWTPNQNWMNAAAAIHCHEQWTGHTGTTNASGVATRYNHAINFWNQIGERVWKYGYQEVGVGYLSVYLMVSWTLKDKATNTGVRNIGDFLWNQLVLQLSHLYGFDQMALPGIRQHVHTCGTPLHPESGEMMMWLLFGGIQYEIDREAFLLAETQFLPMVAASSNLQSSAYVVARNIRHTASTHPGFAVKSAERRDGHEETQGRGEASPCYPYIYCHPKYQVGHQVWGGGTRSFHDRVGGVSGLYNEHRRWQLTVKNSNASSLANSLTVSADQNAEHFTPIVVQGRPLTTPYEFMAGLEGTIVSAFNIENTAHPQWLAMAIPTVFTSTVTSGNWWFGAAATCYVAVYFRRGFALQSARNWYNPQSGSDDILLPWLRSPSGTAQTHVVAVETADPADYASFADFQNAVLASRNGATAGIGSGTNENTPRIVYFDLKGNSFDVTYNGNIIVNGSTITTQHHNATVSSPHHKRLDTPWVQLDYGGNDMLVTDPATGQVTRWRWSDKTVVAL